MAGQMVTLTLMTTAESGVPAGWAKAGEAAGAAASPAQSGAARASLRIAFRIASLHHGRGDGGGLFNIHAMQGKGSPRLRDKAPAWLETTVGSMLEECNEEISGGDRGRRAGRRGARRAARDAGHLLRAGRKPHRARTHSQGPEPHPPHPRTLLLHGHRR